MFLNPFALDTHLIHKGIWVVEICVDSFLSVVVVRLQILSNR